MTRKFRGQSRFPTGIIVGGGPGRAGTERLPPIQFNNPYDSTQTVYDDYIVGGLAVGVGTSAPTLTTFRDGLKLYAFAGTGTLDDEAFFTVHILHDILVSSVPTFHVHWTHNNATPNGQVKWYLDISIAKGYGVTAFGSAVTYSVTQSAAAQYTHHITDDDAMALSTAQASHIEPDCVVIGRIHRDPADPADTFGANAFLVQIDMHYEKGQIGTVERNRGFTAEGFGA